MFTFDLADKLEGTGVTVNALHPATLMDTNMVLSRGAPVRSSVSEGAEAVLHLVNSPDIGTGEYFDGTRPARANTQAYDVAARERLRSLSLQLLNLDQRNDTDEAGQSRAPDRIGFVRAVARAVGGAESGHIPAQLALRERAARRIRAHRLAAILIEITEHAEGTRIESRPAPPSATVPPTAEAAPPDDAQALTAGMARAENTQAPSVAAERTSAEVTVAERLRYRSALLAI